MRTAKAFITSSLIGMLGGLIGLGGAEFRLPVLVGMFHFSTLSAVVINLAISLVTVCFSLLFRTATIPFTQLLEHTPIILNLLAGSLFGSYLGVHFATKINAKKLNQLVLLFLVFLGFLLIFHGIALSENTSLNVTPGIRLGLGILAGMIIGVFSSMLGVAGGELIIPTLLILFSVDMKLAGSLSLVISIPTIIVGLVKYHSHNSLQPFINQRAFIFAMASGSIIGAFIGSCFLTYVSTHALKIGLGIILLFSAIKLFYRRS